MLSIFQSLLFLGSVEAHWGCRCVRGRHECVFACMHEYALNKDSMQRKHDCLCAAWEEVVSVFLCPSVSTI